MNQYRHKDKSEYSSVRGEHIIPQHKLNKLARSLGLGSNESIDEEQEEEETEEDDIVDRNGPAPGFFNDMSRSEIDEWRDGLKDSD